MLSTFHLKPTAKVCEQCKFLKCNMATLFPNADKMLRRSSNLKNVLMRHRVWLKSKMKCSKNILCGLDKYGLGFIIDDNALRKNLQI